MIEEIQTATEQPPPSEPVAPPPPTVKPWYPTGGTATVKPGSRMETVLAYLTERPGVTASEVNTACGKAADMILNDLKRKGLAERR